jgi:hypothetical protein
MQSTVASWEAVAPESSCHRRTDPCQEKARGRQTPVESSITIEEEEEEE